MKYPLRVVRSSHYLKQLTVVDATHKVICTVHDDSHREMFERMVNSANWRNMTWYQWIFNPLTQAQKEREQWLFERNRR